MPGDGYLIEISRSSSVGVEKRRLRLGEGMVYHPGGNADDGTNLYVPVSEYRPDSICHIYKVDLDTLQTVGDPVAFPDHRGATDEVGSSRARSKPVPGQAPRGTHDDESTL